MFSMTPSTRVDVNVACCLSVGQRTQRVEEMIAYKTRIILNIFFSLLMPYSGLAATGKRPITEEDCVRTRRIVEQEVRLSPSGTRVAYVVKEPGLVDNRNHYRLYIRDLTQTGMRENGRLLLDADKLSDLRWLNSGEDRRPSRGKNSKSRRQKGRCGYCRSRGWLHSED